MTFFEKGHPKMGGRRKGTRDRISAALLEAIAKDFEEFGADAVKIARGKPAESKADRFESAPAYNRNRIFAFTNRTSALVASV